MYSVESIVERRPEPKKFKVETPLGSLESDSGNHALDVFSILAVVLFLYFGNKLIGK